MDAGQESIGRRVRLTAKLHDAGGEDSGNDAPPVKRSCCIQNGGAKTPPPF
jgi:hypothetical protein